jgi:hypothetical protein
LKLAGCLQRSMGLLLRVSSFGALEVLGTEGRVRIEIGTNDLRRW